MQTGRRRRHQFPGDEETMFSWRFGDGPQEETTSLLETILFSSHSLQATKRWWFPPLCSDGGDGWWWVVRSRNQYNIFSMRIFPFVFSCCRIFPFVFSCCRNGRNKRKKKNSWLRLGTTLMKRSAKYESLGLKPREYNPNDSKFDL